MRYTLKTEQSTLAMERRIRAAFRASTKYRGYCDTVYEHGQWWVLTGEATYSVVDAEGGDSIDGFDFEEV